MTELEKLRAGEMADITNNEILARCRRARRIQSQLNSLNQDHGAFRVFLRELIPLIPDDTIIIPPFYCDFGDGIHLGKHVFINNGCTFLDGGDIYIGDYCQIGPNCQFLTPYHPTNYIERRSYKEATKPIHIGEDCWFGGGVIVCPGVTIGKRCIIGAGSVVTHDIPDDTMAAGNPAVVKKNLSDKD